MQPRYEDDAHVEAHLLHLDVKLGIEVGSFEDRLLERGRRLKRVKRGLMLKMTSRMC